MQKRLSMDELQVKLVSCVLNSEPDREDEERPLNLFLDNLPTSGTLTDLETGCIVSSYADSIEGVKDSKEEVCVRVPSVCDVPLIVDLKKVRRKKLETSAVGQTREVQKSNLLKRGGTQSSPSTHKKAKLETEVTLLSICGSVIVTTNPVQTEQKLSSKLKTELVQIALRLGLETTGAKSDIVARLMKQYHLDRRAALNRAQPSSSVNR